nr:MULTISPECIES: DUF2285 domain-containing protein [Chelativorans]
MPLVAVPPEFPVGGAPAALDLGGAIAASDGLHLRYRGPGADIQLLVLGGTSPGAPLAALVLLDADALDRLAEIERFWRALIGRPLPADRRLTVQQRRKLRLMLQAVDGRAEQASLREIAEVLFGPSRIAEHPWKTSPWRGRVNRLVRDGRAMISGGYRRLLRQRRRPA